MRTAERFSMLAIGAVSDYFAIAAWAYRRDKSDCTFKAAIVPHLVVVGDFQRLRCWEAA